MAIYKCKMCGGALDVKDNETVAVCEYCGSKQTVPTQSSEVISNLFNRANNLRLKNEFDKAAEIYGKILDEDDTNSEAHWCLLLCKYGIEYVEDPKTYKRIPTCHRAQYTSILTDLDFTSAVEHADAVSKQVYTEQAHEISELQKSILAIVKNEKPFDVFICYKESDENGKRTVDSALANDIYYQLTKEGLRVFYAAITLEDRLGQEYEPYIFAALNTAKVMLVIGTKPEYFDAIWVKNEWSRYLALMKTDRDKMLIPCYRDMDAYELPEEFAHLQAQDMSKIGFINDLVRGIKKVTAKEDQKQSQQTASVQAGSANVASLLKRAFMFLEDKDWQNADEYCEKVLDIDPENAQAYLGKLLAEHQACNLKALKERKQMFNLKSNNYTKCMRFGNDELKKLIDDSILCITNTVRENDYIEAVNTFRSAKTAQDFRKAADLFDLVSPYKDSQALSAQCREQATVVHNEEIYGKARDLLNKAKTEQEFRNAASLFAEIGAYKDAPQLQASCTKNADDIYAKEHSVARKAAKTAVKIPVVIFNTIITIASAGLAILLEIMRMIENPPYNLYNQDGTVILKTVTNSMYTNASIMLAIAAFISLPGLWKRIFKDKYAKWMVVLKWVIVIVLCFAAFWIWKDFFLHGSEYYIIE